jgi:hypothetical protein
VVGSWAYHFAKNGQALFHFALPIFAEKLGTLKSPELNCQAVQLAGWPKDAEL